MLDIFSSIPIRARDVSSNLIHAQIQIHEKELFTGLFHINGKEPSAFLFAQGKLFAVYKLSEKRWLNLPPSEWEGEITSSSGDFRAVSASMEGLRLLRLFFEADFSEAKTNPSLPANELNSYVGSWQRGDKAGLALVHQNGVSALMLFPAKESVFTEAALINETQTQTGPMVINQIKAWGNRPCQTEFCVYQEQSEAWREYSLRVSFGAFVQFVLRRYEELAGRFLVTDLGEQVNEETQSWGLALSLYGSALSNRQFFETAERAGQTYVTIFDIVGKQMTAVVGEKMATNIYKEAAMQIELNSRMLVQKYILSRIG